MRPCQSSLGFAQGSQAALFQLASHRHDRHMERPTKRKKLSSSPAIPAPALVIAASYLNPYQLLTAACVSRLWYSVFTSNAAWAHYNVYGVEDVCSNYLSTKSSSTPAAWADPSRNVAQDTTNLYHILAMMRGEEHWFSEIQRDAPKSFYTALIRANCKTCPAFTWIAPEIQNDKELVYALLRAGCSAYGLDERYRTDRAAALYVQIQSRDDFDLDPNSPTFSPEIFNDYEVAMHAVKLWPNAYDNLPEHFHEDPDLFMAITTTYYGNGGIYFDPFSDAPASLRSNRKLAHMMLAVYPETLKFFSKELQEDWELLRYALSESEPD